MSNSPIDPRAPIEPQASFRRTEGSAAPRLQVSGEIDVFTSPSLRDELYAMIDDGATTVEIDCSQMDFIDSSGLGVLVGALKRIRERGGDFELQGLNPSTRKVFEITGLTKLFTIRD
jgi:anti-sigma B factor antagonist